MLSLIEISCLGNSAPCPRINNHKWESGINMGSSHSFATKHFVKLLKCLLKSRKTIYSELQLCNFVSIGTKVKRVPERGWEKSLSIIKKINEHGKTFSAWHILAGLAKWVPQSLGLQASHMHLGLVLSDKQTGTHSSPAPLPFPGSGFGLAQHRMASDATHQLQRTVSRALLFHHELAWLPQSLVIVLVFFL